MTRRLLLLVPWLVLGALWFVFLRPPVFGGTASWAMVSGHSMEPGMHTGDLVLLERRADYHVGQIVAYRVDGRPIIHRIVGGDARRGFVMKGDNNQLPDPWTPHLRDILGTRTLLLPRAGHYVAVARMPFVAASIAALVTLFVFLVGPTRRRVAVREASP